MRDDLEASPEAVAQAHADMLEQKAAGTWDASRFGDVPARLGPYPVPDGWHTLGEVLAVISADTRAAYDGTPDRALRLLLGHLQRGMAAAHALDGAGRVSRIPSTLWLHLLDRPGGWNNYVLTVVWDCLTGASFEPDYVGRTPVVSSEMFRALTTAHNPEPDQPPAPWATFGSVTAWLRDPASTTFATAVLMRSDWPTAARLDEKAVRRVLVQTLRDGGYLTPSGKPMTLASLSAIRRARG